MNDFLFKYTIAIAKAEQRDDGFYLTGTATGLGVDLQGDEMTPEAIKGFAEQIADRMATGNPIPYMDHHQKGGVLNELGYVTKGWVEPNFDLGIEVRLDEDNAAAMTLYKKAAKGKQYGMSVAGKVPFGGFYTEASKALGKTVRKFTNVLLTEISNTTRPVWTPSFGTVLSKAIDDAVASDSEGVTPVDPVKDEQALDGQDVTDTEKAVDEAAAAETTDTDTTEKAESDEAVDETETEKAEDDAAAEEDVEKAGKAVSKTNAQALLAAYKNMGDTLRTLGVLEDTTEGAEVATEKSDSQDDADTLTKAINDATAPLVAQVEELTKSLREATDRIVQLENTPADGGAPALIDKAQSDDAAKVAELIAKATPSDRIRLGLAARYGQR